MKRFLLTLVALSVFAAIVAASIGVDQGEKGSEVHLAIAKQREIVRVVECSGQIHPRTQVNISAHVVAKIEKLHVKEGDTIAAGAPFVDLEREAFVAGRDTQAAQLEITRTEVQRVKVRLEEADAKLARLKSLRGAGAAAAEEVEAAERERSAAKIELRRANQGVTQARAGLEKADDELTKTTLYAPLAGKVIALNAEEGEVVVSGTMNNQGSVIGTIADVSEMVVEVNVDETEIIHVAPGQSATIRVDAIPEQEMRGRVLEVGSSGIRGANQSEVTSFAVEILLENPDPRLRPEMTARAKINVARHADAIVVPIEAVVRRSAVEDGESERESGADEPDEIDVVFLFEDGTARQRAVRTDLSDATHVEISSGLEVGARVIVGPYRTLKKLADGDAVRESTAKAKKGMRAGSRKDGENSGSDAGDGDD